MAKIVLPDFTKATKDQLLENKRNIEKEVPMYEKHLRHHETLLDRTKRRLELEMAASAISNKKNKMISPVHEFQADDEWVRLQSEILSLETENRFDQMRQEIERLETTVQGTQDEIERLTAALPLITEELEKRGE